MKKLQIDLKRLAGIMAAGLSSASTFMYVVGFSITNDVFKPGRHL